MGCDKTTMRKKNKLRLLLFKECDRNCDGCCNKRWNLDTLEVESNFKGYSEIILTGGEPMLDPSMVIRTIRRIRKEAGGGTKIYMYTAKLDEPHTLLIVLEYLDGLTVTLHEPSDIGDFMAFSNLLFEVDGRSLRLNSFDGVDLSGIDLSNWKVKEGVKWIKDCPLPEDEVFRRLDTIV